jgi:3-deoxy-7-phosphoheptulonate synthase
MQFKQIRKLPTPEEIQAMFPASEYVRQVKAQRDQELADIFTGKDSRFLLIIGPCSADRQDAVLEYITRLAAVQEKVKDKIFIVPRIYTNKPRTTGEGYKGMLHQPDPTAQGNMVDGVQAIREVHTKAIEATGFICADEMLYPENHSYLGDLLGYLAVGARSVEDQQHRLTASGVGIPVGMKNPTSGDFSVMLNSILAAQHPHSFEYRGWEVATPGNPLAHAILRGSVNKHGQNHANYHYEDLARLYTMYPEKGLENMAVIVDCNHSNSGKDYLAQVRIAKEVVHNRSIHKEFEYVKGLMIESYLEDGSQKVEEACYGKSITDPCLGWEKSERLIYDLAEML